MRSVENGGLSGHTARLHVRRGAVPVAEPERSEIYAELLDASLPPKEEGYNVDRPRFLLCDYHKPSKDQATRHSTLLPDTYNTNRARIVQWMPHACR